MLHMSVVTLLLALVVAMLFGEAGDICAVVVTDDGCVDDVAGVFSSCVGGVGLGGGVGVDGVVDVDDNDIGGVDGVDGCIVGGVVF